MCSEITDGVGMDCLPSDKVLLGREATRPHVGARAGTESSCGRSICYWKAVESAQHTAPLSVCAYGDRYCEDFLVRPRVPGRADQWFRDSVSKRRPAPKHSKL